MKKFNGTYSKSSKGSGEYHKFKGYVAWCRPYQPDEYKGNKFWKLNLYPDPENIKKIRTSGLQLKKKDDDGESSGVTGEFYTFRRSCEKEFNDGKTFFCPPEVLDKDGKKLVTYQDSKGETAYTFKAGEEVSQIGDEILIGNGSLVEIDVLVFETKRFGKGHRLNSIKILDLIEYVPDEDKEEKEETPEPEEVKEEPKPVEKKASKKVGW